MAGSADLLLARVFPLVGPKNFLVIMKDGKIYQNTLPQQPHRGSS